MTTKIRNIVNLPDGKFRVRVFLNGSLQGSVHHDLDGALKEKDQLRAMLRERPRLHVRGDEEHARQIALLPPGTNYTRNIHRQKTGRGYNVALTRGSDYINGGFFSGPDALPRAVACRDKLERRYPVTRRTRHI